MLGWAASHSREQGPEPPDTGLRGRWCCQRAVRCTLLEVLRCHAVHTQAHPNPNPNPNPTQASALIKEVEKTFGLNDDEDDDKAEE